MSPSRGRAATAHSSHASRTRGSAGRAEGERRGAIPVASTTTSAGSAVPSARCTWWASTAIASPRTTRSLDALSRMAPAKRATAYAPYRARGKNAEGVAWAPAQATKSSGRSGSRLIFEAGTLRRGTSLSMP